MCPGQKTYVSWLEDTCVWAKEAHNNRRGSLEEGARNNRRGYAPRTLMPPASISDIPVLVLPTTGIHTNR